MKKSPKVYVVIDVKLWDAVKAIAKCEHDHQVQMGSVTWCMGCGALTVDGGEWTMPSHVHTIREKKQTEA